jgi:hypothetical protein
LYAVGVIEIVAGLAVLFSPRWGSLLVAAWLGSIIVNLLTHRPPEYYDIALRDFGRFLGALTLNRLATAFQMTTVAQELPRGEQPRAGASAPPASGDIRRPSRQGRFVAEASCQLVVNFSAPDPRIGRLRVTEKAL